MSKVFAVVLTYNRKELLKRCLDAIYAQTRPCDGVIVIDNASTDGTEDMLRQEHSPFLKVYALSKNIGASGGFNAGFRIAYKNGADFVWMMDDDVIPEPDALLRLEEADALLQREEIDRAFLVSTAFTETGLITNTPDVDDRANSIGYPAWPQLVQHGLLPVRRATFVSILVPRQTLQEHGLPLASMFIWGEDTEYTLRVTRQVPGFMVGASRVQHLRQESGSINIFAESNPNRIRYHRHLIRNEMFVTRKYAKRRRAFMTTLRQWKVMTKLLCLREFEKAAVVFRGVWESRGFRPRKEAADAPIETLGVSVRYFSPAADPQAGLAFEGSSNRRAAERALRLVPSDIDSMLSSEDRDEAASLCQREF
ncbi:glycosyltransferase family 2 protein [Halopseudomonas nanhaiensis]|uniref:glycosyltransferase family 2 protein n=1 Tax=Halopseudomonas nanhaiensis TaxID=2830842 RepID=UPI001CBCCA41|nr:glycosyltransferase family 2 protein [Halopseudomonas nanhaiensis]UAW96856.1 glycosyltransferase family 2 protein [Halopseudomonas nanhaiensis]